MKVIGAGLLLISTTFHAYAIDPDFDRHLNRIEQLLSQQQISEASALAKAIVADNEEQEALHQRLLGYIFLQEGELDRAYVAYKKAIEYKKLPDALRKDALGALVSLAMKRGKPEVAMRYGALYLADYPTFQPVEQLYTRALFSEKYYAQALTQANAIIARYPDVPEYIWQIKLLCEEQLGQHRALINSIRLIQEKFGEDLRWKRKEAAAYARLGEFRRASGMLMRELESGKALSSEDYLSLAQYTALSGKPLKAIEWLDVVLDNGLGVSKRLLQKLKLQYYMQGDRWTQAWNVANELNRTPEFDVLKMQAKIASQLQRWDDATEIAQQAIDMGGDLDPVLWEILGFNAIKANQLAVARSAYLRLRALAPQSDADDWIKTIDLMSK